MTRHTAQAREFSSLTLTRILRVRLIEIFGVRSCESMNLTMADAGSRCRCPSTPKTGILKGAEAIEAQSCNGLRDGFQPCNRGVFRCSDGVSTRELPATQHASKATGRASRVGPRHLRAISMLFTRSSQRNYEVVVLSQGTRLMLPPTLCGIFQFIPAAVRGGANEYSISGG